MAAALAIACSIEIGGSRLHGCAGSIPGVRASPLPAPCTRPNTTASRVRRHPTARRGRWSEASISMTTRVTSGSWLLTPHGLSSPARQSIAVCAGAFDADVREIEHQPARRVLALGDARGRQQPISPRARPLSSRRTGSSERSRASGQQPRPPVAAGFAGPTSLEHRHGLRRGRRARRLHGRLGSGETGRGMAGDSRRGAGIRSVRTPRRRRRGCSLGGDSSTRMVFRALRTRYSAGSLSDRCTRATERPSTPLPAPDARRRSAPARDTRCARRSR